MDCLARGLRDRGHDVTLFTVATSTGPVRREHLFDDGVEPFGRTVPEAAHVLAAHDALAGRVDMVHDHTVLGPLLAARRSPDDPRSWRPTTAPSPASPAASTARSPATPPSSRSRTTTRAAPATCRWRRSSTTASTSTPTGRPAPAVGRRRPAVFVGRMSPEKGVESAVRIAHAAGRPLCIVSKMRDPEEVAYFRERVRPLLSAAEDDVAELGLAERVRLLGRAAALLNPIAWPEPFGLVMAEALATGTPVVTRPLGAAPEIVTDGRTGFLFRTEREGVHAIGRLPSIDRGACRAEAERRFSLQRMAADHERLYAAVLRRAAGGRGPVRAGRVPAPRGPGPTA